MKHSLGIAIIAVITNVLFTTGCPDHATGAGDANDSTCGAWCGSDGECPLDILFVIDNSGSMREEQNNLANSVSSANDSSSTCNTAAVAELKAYAESAETSSFDDWNEAHKSIYRDCGFIERLQVHSNPFHIGILTTDMNDCDSPSGATPRASEPQRGCLHVGPDGNGMPVLKWNTPNLGQYFISAIRNVQTFGSPYEKGLQAVDHFLTPDHAVPDPNECDLSRDCSGDLQEFLRDRVNKANGETVRAKLLIIFLTDEDDCSHTGGIDEVVSGATALCYSSPSSLTPVSQLVDSIKARKCSPKLFSIGAIAGFNNADAAVASGCTLSQNAFSSDCDPAFGNSIANCTLCVNGEPVCPCHPQMVCADGTAYPDSNCCQADAAYRYEAFAAGFDSRKLATLCSSSYRDTLNNILDDVLSW